MGMPVSEHRGQRADPFTVDSQGPDRCDIGDPAEHVAVPSVLTGAASPPPPGRQSAKRIIDGSRYGSPTDLRRVRSRTCFPRGRRPAGGADPYQAAQGERRAGCPNSLWLRGCAHELSSGPEVRLCAVRSAPVDRSSVARWTLDRDRETACPRHRRGAVRNDARVGTATGRSFDAHTEAQIPARATAL